VSQQAHNLSSSWFDSNARYGSETRCKQGLQSFDIGFDSQQGLAFVVQWIRQKPPKFRIQVRFLTRALPRDWINMRVYISDGSPRLVGLVLTALGAIDSAKVFVEDDCIIVEVEE
jgi:hypothetical protein